MLRPVVEQLVCQNKLRIMILALTSARKEFMGVEAQLFGYKDFFGGGDVDLYGETLANEMNSMIDSEETIAYLGQNFLEQVEEFGVDEATQRYKEYGRQGFLPIKSLLHIISNISPDLVVTTNSPRSEKAALMASQIFGVKALALIDMFAIRCLPWFKDKNIADRICVLSEEVKASLVDAGRSSESIVVTGNPAFDPLVNYYRSRKNEINQKRRKRPFTVLWASQLEPAYCGDMRKSGDENLPNKVESELECIFSKRKDWQLIVRNHPNETVRSYPNFVEISLQQENLTDLLERVDLVVTLTSTVGFQGAILGAQLVTIDKSVFTETMPFSSMGLSKGIVDLNMLESVLEEGSLRAFHDHSCAYSIGDATSRVVNEIYDLLNSSDSHNSIVIKRGG